MWWFYLDQNDLYLGIVFRLIIISNTFQLNDYGVRTSLAVQCERLCPFDKTNNNKVCIMTTLKLLLTILLLLERHKKILSLCYSAYCDYVQYDTYVKYY